MTSISSKSLTGLTSTPVNKVVPYHTKRERQRRNRTQVEKPFIAWDGEGVNLRGAGRRQSYVLFGCSAEPPITSKTGLSTLDCLEYIISIGQKYRNHQHIGYAFNYDSNMILAMLSEKSLERVHKVGDCYLNNEDGYYRVEFRPSKWLRVTRVYTETETRPRRVVSVCIEDIFSYFGCKFVEAYESVCRKPIPDVVLLGKANRRDFTIEQLDAIRKYWEIEIDMLRELGEEFRNNIHSAGINVKRWYGPGALASHVLRRERIGLHMQSPPSAITEASRYAYAAGRFELFALGHNNPGTRVVGVDINSAYPWAISQLPSLAKGDWVEVAEPPSSPVQFSLHHVRIHPRRSSEFFTEPGPLFHRDKVGRISFPWKLDGWYWGPEVWNVKDDPRVEVMEGWQWVPDGSANIKPFEWLTDVYAQRLHWKRIGNPSQLALKLMMNSLYGKMAQRVGWNEKTRRPPTYHQLEWAGWVTSMTRATLYRAMMGLPTSCRLVSAETDAVYFQVPNTVSTAEAVTHLTIGTGLGEWGVEEYDEMMYLQSGLAWMRKGGEWIPKRRGLDEDSFTLDMCVGHLQECAPGQRWKPFRGKTTRFIGLGAALKSSIPTKVRHCVWATADRDITVGDIGKRFHIPGSCAGCVRGGTAYDGLHELCIRSKSFGDPSVYPHDLPWITQVPYRWREELEGDGDIDYEG